MIGTPLLIGGVIVGVILIIGIIWFVSKQKNNTQPLLQEETREATTEPKLAEPYGTNNQEEPELEIQVAPEVVKTPEIQVEPEELIPVPPQVTSPIEEPKPKVNVNISSKTEKLLLKKLEQFEESKAFIKKDVNLNKLAKDFDTNTKYLSEIIKSYKNKNFNQYLNELRINYLIDQLNTNEKVLNTKVSYLASDIGFSSHSTFTTLFTQYIGQSPSEYIKALKEKKKQEEA